jgi:hypothetical protein
MTRRPPTLAGLAYQRRLGEAAALRDAFLREHRAYSIRFSGYNLSRLLNLTGERPERVEAMRGLLDALGLDSCDRRWISAGGVFDHGEFFARDGRPWALVGHPYGIRDEQREDLAELARFTTLRVAVDDRPSYYGFGTNHVRVELAEALVPWNKLRATRWTRYAAREARMAFAGEGLAR